MFEYEIIQKFQKGELKPNQEFATFLNKNKERGGNPVYIALRVDLQGEALTCSWYDKNRRIISNQWTVYRKNMYTEGYVQVSSDWNRAWKKHEDSFNTGS